MTELLTAAQMRAIETAAMAIGEVTGLELMERAGSGVVEAIFEWRPELELTAHKVAVFCGPGNNGGDGFVVARLLKLRGWKVSVFLLGNEAKLPVDAATNCQRWMELGKIKGLAEVPEFEQDYDLYIDALFGTGLTRGLDGESLRVISERIASPYHQERWLAVDIPSGLCADSGRVIGGHDLPHAAITVTFHTEKLGHRLADGPDVCGRVISKDIGLDGTRNIDAVQLVDMDFELDIWPLQKQSGGNKYSLGHALILSGGAGKGGAGRLAARGALRIGAGLVTIACPPEALAENAAQLNAIMLNPIADGVALEEVLKDERINALCLGPALGLDQRTRELVAVALASGRAIVLDADALSAFKDDPQVLFEMLHNNVVLTPHGGEFARLFPDIAAKLSKPAISGPAYSKVDAVREAAVRAGCVVLYKGADTVIADRDRVSINSAHYNRTAPWLATAGSGDVLAGFITGLLARGFNPMQAAETAAWLHVECALAFGPGLIAEDIAEQLPKVFSDLGL